MVEQERAHHSRILVIDGAQNQNETLKNQIEIVARIDSEIQ